MSSFIIVKLEILRKMKKIYVLIAKLIQKYKKVSTLTKKRNMNYAKIVTNAMFLKAVKHY